MLTFQSTKGLHPGTSYSIMNVNLEFADPDTVDRLVDTTGDACSQYQHSPSIWGERFSFPPSSCYSQQWSTPYQPVSPATSEQSSRDQAPSLHTGHNVGFDGGDSVRTPSYHPYNDLFSLFQFLGDSPSRSPVLDASPVDFPDFPDFLPGVEPMSYYHPMYDPRLAGVPLPIPTSSATSEPIICSECRHPPSFSRRFELNRHINEQHRCRHGDCIHLRFPNKKEKLEHERGHNEGGLGFLCGTCSLLGTSPKPLVRMEKLMKHSKDIHKTPKDLEFLQCILKPCYLGQNCGGIYFSSQHDLDKHIGIQHAWYQSRGVTPDGWNYSEALFIFTAEGCICRYVLLTFAHRTNRFQNNYRECECWQCWKAVSWSRS